MTESAANTARWLERRANCSMPNYGSPSIVLDRGEGVYLYDVDGRRYVDLISGIAVNCLGHAHPRLAKAIADQAARLLHVSNLYGIPGQIELAETLARHSCAEKAFFCNSGAEAVEGALKLARLYARANGHEERYGFVCMENSFHGRTYGALSATGQTKYHKGVGPLAPGFVYARFNDLASVEAAIGEHTCAILVEPIQGEGGIVPAERSFLEGCRALCDERGLTLIFDEIQTGMGRTGDAFGYMDSGVEPDVFALAKGLGGGVPIGATLARGAHGDALTAGAHASTFGGNPLACAAALCVCEELFERGLLENVRRVGAHVRERLEDMVARHDLCEQARGRGLMWGLVLSRPGADLVGLLAERGVLGNVTADRVVRVAPPLVISKSEIDEALDALDDALSAWEAR